MIATTMENIRSSAINVSDIEKKYMGRTVLQGVSLALQQGEFGIITGASGSGKSTLLRICCGIENPDKGAVSLLGQGFSELGGRQKRKFIREHAGITLQDPRLDRSMSLIENVLLPAAAKGRKIDYSYLERAIRLFGLADNMYDDVSKMSGGEQMRVSILRAMIPGNDLLFADEPTNHLDSHNKELVFGLFKLATQEFGTTALVVTHDAEYARPFSDIEFCMADGTLTDTKRYVTASSRESIKPLNP